MKIKYTPGENQVEADENLIKALQHHASGAEHQEAFHDEVPRLVIDKMIIAHEKTFANMLAEIEEVLEEDLGRE